MSRYDFRDYTGRRQFIVCNELIGYRAWWVYSRSWDLPPQAEPPILRSVIWTDCHWLPGKVVEAYNYDEFGGNKPGIYALKTPEYVAKYIENCCYSWEENRTFAFGSVYLWGTVIEHANGYRAEFAAVKEITGVINHAAVSFDNEEDLKSNLKTQYEVMSTY